MVRVDVWEHDGYKYDLVQFRKDGERANIRFYCGSNEKMGTIKYSDIQITKYFQRPSRVNEEFEPYKGITYTLPTPITLRKVGDVCDTFDVVSGTYTQKIHSIMLDDTWNWTSYTDDFDTMPNHVFIELTSDNNMSHPLNNSFALTSPTALTYLADIWSKPQYANDNMIAIGMSSVSKTKCQLLIPKSFLNGTPSFNSTKQYLKENNARPETKLRLPFLDFSKTFDINKKLLC